MDTSASSPVVIELPWPPSDNRLIRHAVIPTKGSGPKVAMDPGVREVLRLCKHRLDASLNADLVATIDGLLAPTAGGRAPQPLVVAYPSEDAKEYRRAVDAVLVEKGLPTLVGPLRVVVDLYPPTRRKIDPANRLKALLDSLKRRETGRRKKGFSPAWDPKQRAWLFADDDSQAVQGGWRLCPPVAGGKAVVTLTPITGVEMQGDLFVEDDGCPPPEGELT
jgi:hypothetical protein